MWVMFLEADGRPSARTASSSQKQTANDPRDMNNRYGLYEHNLMECVLQEHSLCIIILGFKNHTKKRYYSIY